MSGVVLARYQFENTRKLVAALRSGSYKEGDYNLLRMPHSDSYSVLGVACDVVDPTGWRLVSSMYVSVHWTHLESRRPTAQVIDYFGFSCDRGWRLPLGAGTMRLHIWAQKERLNFLQVADLIEHKVLY